MGDPSLFEANIVSPGNFKTGSGVIASVGVLPGANRGGKDPNLYRLFLLMDAGGGGTQSVDVDRGIFMPEQVVEITNDGRVVRVSATSVNDALGRRPEK